MKDKGMNSNEQKTSDYLHFFSTIIKSEKARDDPPFLQNRRFLCLNFGYLT
jgi:hypothetical protein